MGIVNNWCLSYLCGTRFLLRPSRLRLTIKVSESTYQGSQHFPPAFLQMHQTRLTFSHFEMKFIEKYQLKDYSYEAGHKEQKKFWRTIKRVLSTTLERCSYKKVFWKYAGNLQQSTHVEPKCDWWMGILL